MDEDFSKLPLEERCAHKNWKARLNGYVFLAELFMNIEDERSNEWTKYVNIIKTIVSDIHEPSLEKGLEVILIFSDRYIDAGKTAVQIMPVLVRRCFASSRPHTKALSIEICMKYIEIGKQDVIIVELLKGTELKTPKLISACIQVINKIIIEFGTKIFEVNCILERVVVLMEDRDANVRNSSKALIVELYRWLGPSIKPYFGKLKPSKLGEVIADITKIQDLSPMPNRFLRADQTHSTNQLLSSSRQPEYNISYNRGEVDPFNATEPVDVLCQVPSEFFSHIKSPKWSERREALESLEKILSRTKRMKNGDFSELFAVLLKVISKDTNIAVVCLAIKCISLCALGLRTNIGPHVLLILKVLSEKLKERKNTIVNSLREAMDALFKCSSLDSLSADLINSLKNKNPNVRSEISLFLSRCFSHLSSTDLGKKTLKPLMSSITAAINDQDPSVRNSAAKALGVAVKIIGEKKLSSLFENIDHQKMEKIRENARSTQINSKEIVEVEFETRCDASNHTLKSERMSIQTDSLNEQHILKSQRIRLTKNELSREMATPNSCRSSKTPRSNMKNHIPESVIAGMADENWVIRSQAVSDLKKRINEIHKLPENVGEVVALLASRILDINPKIATTSISLVVALAEKMGQQFKIYAQIFIPPLLKCIGNSKKWVSQPAIECLDSLWQHCGYSEIFSDGSLAIVLKSGSQTVRVRLCEWISKILSEVTLKDVPREELKKYLTPLFMNLEDRNLEVRDSASKALGILIKLLGPEEVVSTGETYFKCQRNPLTKLIEDNNECLKVESAGDKTILSSYEHPATRHFHLSENEERSPLLDTNNLKHQRVIDEHNNKIIKWEVTTPRTEFVDLLKSLMSAANFSQSLMNHMFHEDFKYQLVAMDMLLDELQHNSQAVVSNLDLILRWLTLRFIDTCSVVLARGLDFLNVTLDVLLKKNYCFLDSEASTLVPYVILKLADPRDEVHVKVKDVLLKVSNLYPVSKLSRFVMDGFRTKSIRQKVNCLDILKSFIDIYGETVYMKDLDSMAKQIVKLLKDRDPEIKKGAFPVAASLLAQEGGKWCKYIEKYAGIEAPAIEQKIRMFMSTRRQASVILPGKNLSSVYSGNNMNTQSCDVEPASTKEMFGAEIEKTVRIYEDRPVFITADKESVTFTLDRELLEETDRTVNASVKSPTLVKVDLEFLKDPKKDLKLSSKSNESCKLLCSSLGSLDRIIDSIQNNNLSLSMKAIKDIDESLNSGENSSLDHVDAIVRRIGQQLHNLAHVDHNLDRLNCYGSIFTLLLTLCNDKRFANRISRTNLCVLLEQLLMLISNNIFHKQEYENYRATINTLILKILVNGRKTDLLCGLLEKMGTPSIAGEMRDLYMKCLWKLNRSHSSWDAELDYYEVFKSMRTLTKTYDFPWWTSEKNDYSLRTMKTILRSMVKSRGERVVNDSQIDQSSDADRGFGIYLTKLLQSIKSTKEGSLEWKNLPKPDLIVRHAQELSDILNTVSTDPTFGLERLNKFCDDHPQVDIHRFISMAAPAFLKYFRWFNSQRNQSQEATTQTDDEVCVTTEPMSRDDFSDEVKNMWGRLKILQERIRSA